MKPTRRRKRSPRFADIAAAAGVSPATVDRVFNERESVSDRTRKKVVAASRVLGVQRLLPNTSHGLVHIDVLLPTNKTPFYQRLNQAFQRAIAILDKRIAVHRNFISERREDLFVNAIINPSYRRQGLVIAGPDTERVRRALRAVTAAGEPAVAVVTNISDVQGLTYVGIDHYRAGRTAGHVLGRFARRHGRVLFLSGHKDYRGHLERIAGCRDGVAHANPGLDFTSPHVEARDDEELCYRAVSAALRAGAPVAGIYNSGAGSAGIEAALRKSGAADLVCWVTHEISDDHRRYLEQGILDLAIDQDPDWQAITAIQHVLHAGDFLEETLAPAASSEFRLYFAENTPMRSYLTVC